MTTNIGTEKQQTIFRGAHGELPYFMMLRTTAQDSTLSFEARGLIAYLLSKPNDWEINKADLMREGGLGRTKMKRIMDELTTAGYMTISQERDENERFLVVVYTLHEEPQAQNVQAEPSGAGSTKPAERKTRRAENDPQHNTESLQSTEITSSEPPKAARDAIFDALALHVFKAKKGTPSYQAVAGRVAKLAWWCVGREMEVGRKPDKRTIAGCNLPVTPRHVEQWAGSWDGDRLPSTPEKFVQHFYEWLVKQSIASPVEQSSTTTSHATREALGLVD